LVLLCQQGRVPFINARMIVDQRRQVNDRATAPGISTIGCDRHGAIEGRHH
jgi:hypothetical protein